MSLFYRAFLYLTRKYEKSLLLFGLLLVIATLTLSGMSVRDAARTAQLNVRQALGGIFTMEQNTNDAGKWKSKAVGNYGEQSWYTGEPLTKELADTIMEQVDGIRGCNASAVNYVVPSEISGKTLALIESEGDSDMSGLLSGYGDFTSTIAAYASTDTAFDSYFTGGYLELTKGRHVTAEDQNAVLLSEELAEKNGLKVGDKLLLHMSEFKASMMGIDPAKTQVEVEIAGLFHATAKSSAALSNWSMDNALYTTLDVVRRVRPDTPDEGYEKITFYVDDPARLEQIVEQVKSLPNMDPTDFVVQSDTSAVDAVMEPLANMDRLVSVLILLVLIVGAAILYFILAGRIRERMHESGILMSLGFSRINIAIQYLTEVLVIAVLAFTLSVFVSGAVSGAVGKQLFDYTMRDMPSGEDAGTPGTYIDGNTIVNSGDYAPHFKEQGSLTRIQVSIRPSAVVFLYVAGMAIICLSVGAAVTPILRMKPREILSKMN